MILLQFYRHPLGGFQLGPHRGEVCPRQHFRGKHASQAHMQEWVLHSQTRWLEVPQEGVPGSSAPCLPRFPKTRPVTGKKCLRVAKKWRAPWGPGKPEKGGSAVLSHPTQLRQS